MHLISTIEVEGFRSIRKGKVDDLGDFTALAGLNNSGKSNLLRALNAFFGGHSEPGRPLNLATDHLYKGTRRRGNVSSWKAEKSTSLCFPATSTSSPARTPRRHPRLGRWDWRGSSQLNCRGWALGMGSRARVERDDRRASGCRPSRSRRRAEPA